MVADSGTGVPACVAAKRREKGCFVVRGRALAWATSVGRFILALSGLLLLTGASLAHTRPTFLPFPEELPPQVAYPEAALINGTILSVALDECTSVRQSSLFDRFGLRAFAVHCALASVALFDLPSMTTEPKWRAASPIAIVLSDHRANIAIHRGENPSLFLSLHAAWLWSAGALLLIAPARHIPRALRRRATHLCPTCAYDLRGLPPEAPCPECGAR